MKLTGLIVASSLLSLAPSLVAESMDITVLSFNIRNGGRRLDGVYDRPLQQKVVAARKPNLFAMQEVDRKTSRVGGVDVPAEFAEALSMKFHYAPAMKFAGGEYGTAAFSTFPISAEESIPMVYKGVEPRCAALLVVKLPTAGNLTFVSVHLDSGKKGDARVDNMKALLARLKAVTTPAIVAGDFNDGPESEAITMLVKAGFRRCVPTGDARSIPADKPVDAIDHILIRDGAGMHLEDVGTAVQEEPRASDHRPILSHIRVTPNEASPARS